MVVHHKVETAADTALVAEGGKLTQIINRAERRLYFSKIRYRIAAVAVLLGAFQQGHEVDIVNAALRKIIESFDNAFEVAGEIIHIQHHADNLVAAIPKRMFLPIAVAFFQSLTPIVVVLLYQLAQVIEPLLVVVVQLIVEAFQPS